MHFGADVVSTMTEAVWSPRFGKNIAVGMLASGIAGDEQGLEATIDDDRRPVSVTGLPFY